MEGNFKYSAEEVKQIVLDYHTKHILIPFLPADLIWVAVSRAYGEVGIILEKKGNGEDTSNFGEKGILQNGRI